MESSERRYKELLARAEELTRDRHLLEAAATFRMGREELDVENSPVQIEEHAARTARSLGGMESIGEIAVARGDQELLRLVEALYAICKDISGKNLGAVHT